MEVASSNDGFFPPGIQEYFSGKTVFLTGATGLVGQLILEKLLRTCLDIKRIYVLIREKKGKRVEERLKELFDNVMYTKLKSANLSYGEKVTAVKGDNSHEGLAMSSENVQKLIEEVNCVIHCSANVRFDKNIRDMVYTNVMGTIELTRLARKMKNLQSFVYVSTAFSNCPKSEIDEVLYEPPMSPEKLLNLVNTFDNKFLEKLTPSLIGNWPNTYVYTKCISESVVEREGRGLPVAIVRPSVVVPTYKEPLEGWANNVYGTIGVTVAGALGLAHVFNCEKHYVSDQVPADYVANNIIAAAWSLGTERLYKNRTPIEGVKVYNCVSSPQNPVTWSYYLSIINDIGRNLIPMELVWYPFLIYVSSPTLYLILDFFLHLIPAYIGDFFAASIGKKTMFVKTYNKLHKLSHVLTYFTTREWKFSNDNTLRLWRSLSKEDQEKYPFDMTLFNWRDMVWIGLKGGRVYILNDPLETLPKARRKYFLLKALHYGLTLFILFGFSMFMFFICKRLTRMVY